MTKNEIRTYVSSLIQEAREQQVLPAAHVMHVLAGNIEAGNLTAVEIIGNILQEAASRPDRDLGSHPLAEGFTWCPGCGAATASVVDGTCLECHREGLARTLQPGAG